VPHDTALSLLLPHWPPPEQCESAFAAQIISETPQKEPVPKTRNGAKAKSSNLNAIFSAGCHPPTHPAILFVYGVLD